MRGHRGGGLTAEVKGAGENPMPGGPQSRGGGLVAIDE